MYYMNPMIFNSNVKEITAFTKIIEINTDSVETTSGISMLTH